MGTISSRGSIRFCAVLFKPRFTSQLREEPALQPSGVSSTRGGVFHSSKRSFSLRHNILMLLLRKNELKKKKQQQLHSWTRALYTAHHQGATVKLWPRFGVHQAG